MNFFPEQDDHIINKVKIVLNFQIMEPTKIHTTDVDTSDLAPKKDFVALKAEIDKPDINKQIKVPTSLNT